MPGDGLFHCIINGSVAPFTNTPAWINKYIHDKVWSEMTYPFQSLNSAVF